MKLFQKSYFPFILVLFATFIWSCSDDDDAPTAPTEVASKTYPLNSVAVNGISGTAKIISYSDGSVELEIELQNTPAGGVHPAHIHANTAAEGGGILLSLTPVDGDTGKSTTKITALDDGTAIDYAGLLEIDGYINVHLSATELATIVAQGDIGQNELTDVSKMYTLSSVAVPDISGTATFTARANGEALAVISLQNTPAGGSHPAHIHMNDAATGGGIAVSFNPVNGDTGLSVTNISALDDGTAFVYSDVLTYDGYINVHLSATELATIVAQGNIGSNEGEPIPSVLAGIQ